VIIGSASIVLVVTIALTSRKYVISQIEAVGSNLVWAEMIRTPDKAQPLSHELTLADMEAVKSGIPGVVTVAGISDIPMTIAVEGKVKPVALIGVTLGYQQIRKLIIYRSPKNWPRRFTASTTRWGAACAWASLRLR
jgi:putative ABC transport system permease protein